MQSSGSYQNCCVCTHCASRGVNGDRKCIFDGYRRFLEPESPGRQQRVEHNGFTYEYKDVCTRSTPTYRDNETVVLALRYKKTSVAGNTPVLGHKALPLIWNWPEFSWLRFNAPELAHGVLCLHVSACLFQPSPTLIHIIDSKVTLEMLLKLFVGYANDGFYKSWKCDRKHRLECKTHNVFRATWPEGDNEGGPLPWRLTRDQRQKLNQRMSRVKWPHYIEPLYYDGASFWVKPGRLWKIHRKV